MGTLAVRRPARGPLVIRALRDLEGRAAFRGQDEQLAMSGAEAVEGDFPPVRRPGGIERIRRVARQLPRLPAGQPDAINLLRAAAVGVEGEPAAVREIGRASCRERV